MVGGGSEGRREGWRAGGREGVEAPDSFIAPPPPTQNIRSRKIEIQKKYVLFVLIWSAVYFIQKERKNNRIKIKAADFTGMNSKLSSSSSSHARSLYLQRVNFGSTSPSCLSQGGPTLRSASIGPSSISLGGTRLPSGHDSPHLSRAHRSQTPLTQHAPYSLFPFFFFSLLSLPQSSHDSRLPAHKRKRREKYIYIYISAKQGIRVSKASLCLYASVCAREERKTKKKKTPNTPDLRGMNETRA